VSAKNLPGGGTEMVNVRQIRRINNHPVKSDENSMPETISDPQNWLNWNGNLNHTKDRKDDCAADGESYIAQHNGMEDAECPELRDVTAESNVPELIWAPWNSQRQAGKVLVTDNPIEMRWNQGVKKL